MSQPTMEQARGNRLLAPLPQADLETLLPNLETISVGIREIVYEDGEPVTAAYLPLSCVICLVHVMRDGTISEAATIGREGAVGLGGLRLTSRSEGRALVQLPGDALRIETAALRSIIADSPTLLARLDRYERAFMLQVVQSVGCNQLHSARRRLCRWLLAMHDRAGSDSFPLTQEFMADLLAVQRTTISEIASELQRAGAIRYSRGQITVVDARALEAEACECYRTVRDLFDELLGPSFWQP